MALRRGPVMHGPMRPLRWPASAREAGWPVMKPGNLAGG